MFCAPFLIKQEWYSLNYDLSNAKKLTAQFVKTARSDDAESGQCARGVGNILQNLGIPFERGHAYQWKDNLPKNGWVQLKVSAEDAPPGAVLVYDRKPNWAPLDPKNPKNLGAIYGHVEIVGLGEDNNRTYISDKERKHAGGSDPSRKLTVLVHPALSGQANIDRLLLSIENGNPGEWRGDGAHDNDRDAAAAFFEETFLGRLLGVMAVVSGLFPQDPETGVRTWNGLLQPTEEVPVVDSSPPTFS